MPGAPTFRPDAQHDGATSATMRSAGVEQTRQLGAALGRLLKRGDVVLLQGNLGAGKTALTQGIGEGMGVHGVINSPTFTILKEYSGPITLYHFDLYRIDDPDEVYALGFEDYLSGDGVCVVEWAERGEGAAVGDMPWPASYLRVALSRAEDTGSDVRQITVTGAGLRGAELAAAWQTAAAEVF